MVPVERKRFRLTLKGRIQLFFCAFFAVLCIQLGLNHYQTNVILTELDTLLGNFHAMSQFQSGVEQQLSALESYRWENGDADALLQTLRAGSSTTNAYLWRIEGDLDEVGEEQYLLYSAIETTYASYTVLLNELCEDLQNGDMDAAAALYYDDVQDCGSYLRQYTQQLLETAITDSRSSYAALAGLSGRLKMLQVLAAALCVVTGLLAASSLMQLLTPVQQMISASNAIGRGELDTPDVPLPRQTEMEQLARAFNGMKHSMAGQMNTLREKAEIERELHRQKMQTLELQSRMERSRLQQLRSQIDPHFLFNTLNVILQTAAQENAYRTQALITALAHLLRYSLMSNDEQVPLAREVKVVDEYYSIYHIRFGERIQLRWRIADDIDLTEMLVPSFILQPIVENAFKHGISPKEEGGAVRIRISALPQKGLLYISVCDNGCGIQPQRLAQLQQMLAGGGQQWEHIGIYNVAARLRLLDARAKMTLRSKPGRGTVVALYLPLRVQTEDGTEEECGDDADPDRG